MKNLLTESKLGKTGITVTRLGGGGHFTIGPRGHNDIPRRVREIQRQIDSGITYFDVQWEPEAAAMAQAMRTRKSGFTVAWPLHGVTKLGADLTRDYIVSYCHEYARRFGIERMDILLWIALEVHPETESGVMDEVREALGKLRAEGLCGCFGFSCHHSPQMALRAISNFDDFAVMMVPYGPLLPAAGRELLSLARSRKIGTVGMKPFGGGNGFFNRVWSGELAIQELEAWKGSARPFEAAVRWVLSNEHLDCAVPGTSSEDEIDALVAAALQPASREDGAILEAFARALGEASARNRVEEAWK